MFLIIQIVQQQQQQIDTVYVLILKQHCPHTVFMTSPSQCKVYNDIHETMECVVRSRCVCVHVCPYMVAIKGRRDITCNHVPLSLFKKRGREGERGETHENHNTHTR